MPWGRGPAGRSRARHLGVLFGLTAGLTLAGTRVGRAGEARLTVAAELAPASDLTLAVASARALRALERARADYANSDFAGCNNRLTSTSGALVAALHLSLAHGPLHDQALELLHRATQWRGLCLSVAGDAAAALEAFRAASRLPGPDPSADVFPPAAQRLYQRAKRTRGAPCAWPPGTHAPAELDGAPFDPRRLLTRGPHHAVWRDSPPYRSPWQGARIRLGESCELQIDLPIGPPALTGEEARDVGLLGAIAQLLGVSQLEIVGALAPQRRARFDRSSGTVVPQPEAPAPATARVPPRALPRAVDLAPGPAADPPARRGSWYRRWWPWAVLGAVVVTGVVVPLAVVRPTRYEFSF